MANREGVGPVANREGVCARGGGWGPVVVCVPVADRGGWGSVADHDIQYQISSLQRNNDNNNDGCVLCIPDRVMPHPPCAGARAPGRPTIDNGADRVRGRVPALRDEAMKFAS